MTVLCRTLDSRLYTELFPGMELAVFARLFGNTWAQVCNSWFSFQKVQVRTELEDGEPGPGHTGTRGFRSSADQGLGARLSGRPWDWDSLETPTLNVVSRSIVTSMAPFQSLMLPSISSSPPVSSASEHLALVGSWNPGSLAWVLGRSSVSPTGVACVHYILWCTFYAGRELFSCVPKFFLCP